MATVSMELHLRADYSEEAIATGDYSGSHVGGVRFSLDIADESPLTAAGVLQETMRYLAVWLRNEAESEGRGSR